MQLDFISLFPSIIEAALICGVNAGAKDRGLWNYHVWNPRDFSSDPHRRVDDRPFGGGPGMVMMAEPLAVSVEAAIHRQMALGLPKPSVIYATPRGKLFTQKVACRLKELPGLVLVAGRYEGVDERFIHTCVDECWSLGDFVMTGGELAILAMADTVVRLLPGVIQEASIAEESFQGNALDWAHFTRPAMWRGQETPPVLLSGHHEDILAWRKAEALDTTRVLRPDLLKNE